MTPWCCRSPQNNGRPLGHSSAVRPLRQPPGGSGWIFPRFHGTMQIFLRTLLAIYLGHLAADFVFQTRRLVEAKLRGRLSAYLLHGLIHYLSAILLVGFFIPGL